MQTDDSKPWGNPIPRLQDDDRVFRFVFLNIGGFPVSSPHNPKLRAFKTFVTKNSIDVVGLAEMNAQWNRLDPHQQLSELTLDWRDHRPRTALGYFRQSHVPAKRVFGGTAVMSFHTVRDRSRTSGCDTRGLGRWSWTRFQGRQGVYVRCVACYRPVFNTTYAGSVWSQHRTFLQNQDIDTDPRLQFFIDLGAEVATWLQQGDQIILGIDVNEDVRSPSLLQTFRGMGLRNLLLHAHGPSLPATSATGSAPIDAIFVTPGLLGCQCGLMPLGDYDHRPVWIDVPYEQAFGYTAEHSAPGKIRKLRTDDPATVRRYHEALRSQMAKSNLATRMDTLYAGITVGTPLTTPQASEYELIKALYLAAVLEAETKCRKLRVGAVDYSPMYRRLRFTIGYWQLVRKYARGQRVSRRLIHRYAKKAGIKIDYDSWTVPDAQLALTRAYGRNKELKRLDYQLATQARDSFREKLAAEKAEAGKLDAAYHIRQARQREKQRRDARLIRSLHSPDRTGAVNAVIGPPFVGEQAFPDQPWIEYTSKTDIERACLWENCRRFNQAHTTPPMTAPLFQALGTMGTTSFAQDVMDGNFTAPAGTDPWAAKLLRELCYVPAVADGKRMSLELPPDKYLRSWRVARESTAPGPSGFHFGHFKANTGAEAEDLGRFDTMMAAIPYQTGHSPAIWQHGTNCMLEKKKGNFRVDKLRAILLYEAEYNMVQKILGRDCMFLAEDLGAVAKEQYGCRKEHSSVNQGLNKTLTFDLIRQTRQTGALCSNDAKSCFDRITHSIASLSLQRVGVPKAPLICIFTTLRRLEHRIRTVYGDSDIGFSGRLWSVPIQGVGQGNGAGPQIWALVSTPVLNMLRREGYGAVFQPSLDPQSRVHFVGYSFVDDTDLVVSSPDALSPETTAARMQDALDAWEGGIRGTGGALVPDKSFWYLVSFQWKSGIWSYRSNVDSPAELSLRDLNGDRKTLRRLNYDEAERTLGVYLAPDGNMVKQREVLREKGTIWADRVRTGNLPRRLAWLDYTTTISRTLGYPLAATTLSREDCRYIMTPVKMAILPAAGFIRTTPNAVAYGTKRALGIGVHDLWIDQGIEHLFRLVGLGHCDTDVTGELLRTSYQQLTLELGMGDLPYSLPFAVWSPLATPCWHTCTWEFISTYNLQVDFRSRTLPLRRLHDRFLNDLASALSIADRQAFNRCRLFKQVVTLADLCSGDGLCFLPRAMPPSGPFSDSWSTCRYKWPTQGRPTSRDWKVWKTCLQSIVTRDLLRQPLGPWLGSTVAPTGWLHCNSEMSLYQEVADGFIRHPTFLRRGSGATQQLFKRSSRTPVPSCPTDALPTTVVTFPTYFRASGAAPIIATPEPDSFSAFLQASDQFCHWAMQGLHLENLPLLLECWKAGIVVTGVSDGSFQNERSTACWIFQAPGQRNTRIFGHCHVPGPSSTQSAYRGELGGLYGMLVFLTHLQTFYPEVSFPARLFCDGQAALTSVSRRSQRIQPDRNQFDLIGACRTLRYGLRDQPDLLYVMGHADDKRYGPLTEEEYLNVFCDDNAKAFLARTHDSPAPPYEIWQEPARVYVQGLKISGLLRSALEDATAGERCRAHWSERGAFTGPPAGVSWSALSLACTTATKPALTTFATKHACERLPLGVEMVRRKARSHACCPNCSEPFETTDHLLRCPGREQTWTSSLTKLRKWLQTTSSIDTTPHIIRRLQSWHDHTPSLPIPPTINELFTHALRAQDLLGWHAFLRGFVAVEWLAAQRQFLTSTGSRVSPERWLASLITKSWEVAWDQWDDRNGWLHRREAHSRRIDLKTQIQDLRSTNPSSLPPKDRSLLRTPLLHLLKSPTDYQESWCTRVQASIARAKRKKDTADAGLHRQRMFMSNFLSQR